MRLKALGTALFTVSVAASASQRTVSDFSLDVVEIGDSSSYFFYSYELSNSGSSTWAIGSVILDISASSGTPAMLTATGEYFDATALTSSVPVQAHAEIGPASPSPWVASIRRSAELSWAPPRPGYLSADSVAPGDTLGGFGLRSSYLPGITEVEVLPTLQACCRDPAVPNGPYPMPDTFAVTGKAVVPRYMPSEIDIDLVQAQLDAVCDDPLWIDDSSLCSEMADSLDAAEARLAINDAPGGRAALVGFRSLIQSNVVPSGDIEVNAAYLLGLNTLQLLTNIGFPTYYP